MDSPKRFNTNMQDMGRFVELLDVIAEAYCWYIIVLCYHREKVTTQGPGLLLNFKLLEGRQQHSKHSQALQPLVLVLVAAASCKQ